jgi:hypothetical protein
VYNGGDENDPETSSLDLSFKSHVYNESTSGNMRTASVEDESNELNTTNEIKVFGIDK